MRVRKKKGLTMRYTIAVIIILLILIFLIYIMSKFFALADKFHGII